jgi:hypothetical protein
MKPALPLSLLNDLTRREPLLWLNENRRPVRDVQSFRLSIGDVQDAEARWRRFGAPLMQLP